MVQVFSVEGEMIKKERSFKHGQFVDYFVAQPDDSDYWEDQIAFCEHILYKCEVCWTCTMFNLVTSKCDFANRVIKVPGKQKCHLFRPKANE